MKARPGPPEITLLSGMLGGDFRGALDRHQAMGLRLLDLKDAIFGKNFVDLTPGEARAARALIEERDVEIYALSSSLCRENVERGEAAFRQAVESKLERVLSVAALLCPRAIRLLSAWSSRRSETPDSIAHLDRVHPWVYHVYRDCIDHLSGAGYEVFIENETEQDIFSNPAEVRAFFERLDRTGKVSFTWDIQNLWQMGTPPGIAVYEELKPLIGYLHFKGGQAGADGKLAWASSLEDASWAVGEVTRRAVSDGKIAVFCLNPSHGARRPGYDYASVVERDVRYLQSLVAS